MPNERNIHALRVLLAKEPYEIELRDFDRRLVDDPMLFLAEWLAARGVLVPSTLTDADCRDLTEHGWDGAGDVPAMLERIARGD